MEWSRSRSSRSKSKKHALVVRAAVSAWCPLACGLFCAWESTALSRYQAVLAHAFPKGVARSAHRTAQSPPLPASRAAGIPSTSSPLVRPPETTIALQTCVTCLRADR